MLRVLNYWPCSLHLFPRKPGGHRQVLPSLHIPSFSQEGEQDTKEDRRGLQHGCTFNNWPWTRPVLGKYILAHWLYFMHIYCKQWCMWTIIDVAEFTIAKGDLQACPARLHHWYLPKGFCKLVQLGLIFKINYHYNHYLLCTQRIFVYKMLSTLYRKQLWPQ